MGRNIDLNCLRWFQRKNNMDQNEKKYPVEKAKGSSKKYTEL